ncbi:redoxin domain-containing protein [Halomicroarcula sp. GCM10025710]
MALEEFLGEDVVVLAFIPGDFNPACDEQSCDLEELDLFTMQKDVTVLGISPDSVYSHRAFADTYDLTIPLLADTDHEVARQYDVEFVDDLGQRLVERAVVVIDHDGVVQYTWSTTDPDRRPDVEPVKDAIGETGGDDTAFACYRVGHAHYTEGRRAFTAAMESFNESEWMLAQGDFQQAREEFEAAEDQFDTAARFVDDPTVATVYEGAQTKTNALWQAAAWLAKSANQYSSGNGVAGRTLREDAERRLEAARDYRDPRIPTSGRRTSWTCDATVTVEPQAICSPERRAKRRPSTSTSTPKSNLKRTQHPQPARRNQMSVSGPPVRPNSSRRATRTSTTRSWRRYTPKWKRAIRATTPTRRTAHRETGPPTSRRTGPSDDRE